MEPNFDGVSHGSRGRYVGQRGKQKKAGAGFTTRNYVGGSDRATAVVEPQSALVLPPQVLSVRASSQKLASRIAGCSREAADNDSVRQALIDMLSSDWSTPASATESKTRGSRAGTAPATDAAKPQRLPPISTSANATLICDPHERSLRGVLGADPPRWSGTRVRQSAPAGMDTKPFGAEQRSSSTRTAFMLGPGDIETQVAAVAQHIRASKSAAQSKRCRPNVATVPSPPRRSLCVLALPNSLSPGKTVGGSFASQPMGPMGHPRVAETSEERARKAVAALTNRYTVRIGAAAEKAQIIGKADPTWTAAEIKRYSTHPGVADAEHSEGGKASKTVKRRTAPPSAARAETAAPGRGEKQPLLPPKARTTNEQSAKVRGAKPKNHTWRHPETDRKAAGVRSDRLACETSKTVEMTERDVLEHDMDVDSGLTGWGELDE
eukprot:COSAG02_NODE_1524_length_12129_cov_3.373067_1_plen_437_part_00